MILTAIYEYAHAIYPAAYITIGTCARYGLERRRFWWAIVILDRVVAQWSPTSPDPRAGDLLPVDDQAWDDENIDTSRISPVSSPLNTNMGMFARLSQLHISLGASRDTGMLPPVMRNSTGKTEPS